MGCQALEVSSDVIEEHDDGILLIVCVIALTHCHGRETEVPVQALGTSIRGPDLQHRLATAQFDGAGQDARQQLVADVPATELGMDGEIGDVYFVSHNPSAGVPGHATLLMPLDKASYEQVRDVIFVQFAEENVARPWCGEGHTLDVEHRLQICFSHPFDAHGEPVGWG